MALTQWEMRDGAKACLHAGGLFGREDADGREGACVREAGAEFDLEETPVEGEGALPVFEGGVEGIAEAA